MSGTCRVDDSAVAAYAGDRLPSITTEQGSIADITKAFTMVYNIVFRQRG